MDLAAESTDEGITFLAGSVECYLCGFGATGPEEVAALREISRGSATPSLSSPHGGEAKGEGPEFTALEI